MTTPPPEAGDASAPDVDEITRIIRILRYILTPYIDLSEMPTDQAEQLRCIFDDSRAPIIDPPLAEALYESWLDPASRLQVAQFAATSEVAKNSSHVWLRRGALTVIRVYSLILDQLEHCQSPEEIIRMLNSTESDDALWAALATLQNQSRMRHASPLIIRRAKQVISDRPDRDAN